MHHLSISKALHLMLMCFAEATLVSNPTCPIEIGYYELVLYGVAVKDL